MFGNDHTFLFPEDRYLITIRGELYKRVPFDCEMTGTHTAKQAKALSRVYRSEGFRTSILKLN